tara:strand:- start:9088 stop:9372 length:285 start_codon:yes stop_codon:yes gene_type:complete
LKSGDFEMYFVYSDVDDSLMGIVVVASEISDKILLVLGAAGDVNNQWEMLDKDYTELAKSKGCTSYEFRARRGFLRTFKKFGIVEKYTVMRKTF